MVKTALVAMTLLGCDCDANVCQFVTELPQQFASVPECEAAMQSHVLRSSDLDYPLVTGQCRVVGDPGIRLADAGAPDSLAASLATAETPAVPRDGRTAVPARGSSSLVFEKTASSYRMVATGVGRAADFVFQTARSAAGSVSPALDRMASLLPGD